MKKYLYLLLLLSSNLSAQQTSRLAQSADEFGSDNPAGLSIEEMRNRGTVVNLLLRNQWWKPGASGYPQTQTLTWLDNTSQRHQIGAALLADKIGETRQAGLSVRYAHQLAEGLYVGVSAGMYSHRIFTENLDQYDEGDPLATAAGDTRWRLLTGAGIFYKHYKPLLAFRWFAGLSFRRVAFQDEIGEGQTSPAETDLLAQGGVSWNAWWMGARLRYSLNQPAALDLYVRRYLSNEKIANNFFAGGIFTADEQHRTAGLQAGYEKQIASEGFWNNHFLTASLGFSKPLSKFIQGGNLIFDARATWSWQRKAK